MTAQAESVEISENYVDILPLEIQFRYEDSSDQSRTTHQYQAYDLAYQHTAFRFELQWSQYYDSTGNSTLKINQTIRELNLGLGYRVYHLSEPNNKLDLSSFVVFWGGQTQTEIETILLSTKNSVLSEKDNVYGVGINLVGRINYFIAETDFKYLTSKNMSPLQVPVFGIKIGAGIPFDF
jgi:hypothetical protein